MCNPLSPLRDALRQDALRRKLIYFVSFILVPGLVLTSAAEATDPDLVGYWKFDETSGTTAYDSSGNGQDGTLNGDPQWAAGMLGGALELDGIDDYVEVPDNESLHLWERFTLAAWIYQVESSSSRIIDKIGAGTANGPHLDTHPGTTLRSCSGTCVSTAVDYSLEEWHHVAVTFDEGDVKLYIDGSIEGEGSAPSPLAGNSLPLRIGADSDGQSLFHGLIDDVRVYNRALTEAEILAAMEGAGAVYPYAFGPNPRNDTLHEDTWISLDWRAGDFAASHDVYIGDNFDAVSEGTESTFVGNQADTFLVIGFPGFPYPNGLVPGTTYYWRIDEVNDIEPNSPWKGKIWSFSIPPKTAYTPDPADGAEAVDTDVTLSWTGGFGAKLHTVYFGDNFDEVDNAAGGQAQGTPTYTPGTLKMAKTYYWRVDEFDVVETYKGDVWSFTTQGAVSSPEPANGAVDITQTPILTWSPGVFGASHEIYFGTDKEAVKNADTSSPEYKGGGNLGSESYGAGELKWESTYYWRIDEANDTNPDSPWTGPLWSFTTANFLIIDDMESYNDLDPTDPASNRIFLAWIDGFDNPAINGSIVGYANPPFAEQSIVHGGNQSMPMLYDNSVGKSEATLTLTSNRDWTVKGVNTLTIWFRGNSSNAAETMYVVLNDSAGINNDNPDAALINKWTQWDINLQDFVNQGVNLSNINTITLGFGNRANPLAGGAGMMFFDDIKLTSTYSTSSSLVSHWKFDERTGTTAFDSWGSNDGTITGASWANGLLGGALDFDGSGDYVNVENDGSLEIDITNSNVTISAWVYPKVLDNYEPVFVVDDYDGAYYGYMLMITPNGNVWLTYGDGTGADPNNRRTKTGTTSLQTNIWYHVVGVIRGATDMRIFINGIDDGGRYSGNGGEVSYSSASASIGRVRFGTLDNEFNGSLDDVMVFDRALTEGEVRLLPVLLKRGIPLP